MSSSSQPVGSENSSSAAYAAGTANAATGVGDAAVGVGGAKQPKPQAYADGMSKSSQKYGNVNVGSFNSGRPTLYAPDSTSTTETQEVDAPVTDTEIATMQASVNYSNSLLSAAYRVSDSIPSDTDKVIFLNYLKAIGDALTKAQQQLYELQLAQTMASSVAKQSEVDVINAQAAVRKKEREDIKAQNDQLKKDQEKMEGLSSFMSSLGPWATGFSVALSIATFGGATPLMIAVNVTLLTMTIADSALAPLGINATAEVFGALTQVIIKMDPSIDPKTAEIISNAVMTAVLLAVSAGASAKFAGSLGNALVSNTKTVLASTALIIARSPLIKNLTTAITYQVMINNFPTPKDEKEAQTQKDEAQRTAEMAGLIVGMASSMVLSVGAVAGSTSKERVLEGFERLVTRLRTGFSYGGAAIQFVTMGVGVGRGYVQGDIYGIKGSIENIKAAAEAQEVATQDQIEALKNIIKLILDILSSISGGVSTINELQIKKIKDLSNAVRY
jgi:hypothetical protein